MCVENLIWYIGLLSCVDSWITYDLVFPYKKNLNQSSKQVQAVQLVSISEILEDLVIVNLKDIKYQNHPKLQYVHLHQKCAIFYHV